MPRHLLPWLAVAALVASGSGSATEPASEATMALITAVRQAPSLEAAARRVEAARARIDAAGRLPDPQVEGMGSRMEGPMNESSRMWEVNVRQPLPKRGERAADRDRAQALLEMARAEYVAMATDLAAETAMAIAEAEGAVARVNLLQLQITRLNAVLRSIEAQLGTTSNSRLVERLTVQSRTASMQLMLEEAQRMAEDALADARGRLGLPPDAPLPPYSAPRVADVDLENAAPFLLASARSAEAEAMLRMAQASANPMTAVGLRFERQRTTMGNEDTVGLAFMSEIPWRSRRYARAEARAAQAERSAVQSDVNALRYRLSTALTRVERAERLAATARRLSNETLHRLNAEYDTMLRAASVSGLGGSAVLQTVEVLEKVTDTELQALDAETAARVARAALWTFASTHLALP
jgi:outer membrane protein, heavy metal efflux system